jgi:DNA-binding Lrp family transcriptional regulator
MPPRQAHSSRGKPAGKQAAGPRRGFKPQRPLPGRMDEVDLAIVQRIGVSPFLVWPHPPAATTVAALARALRVSKETVRRRLAAMEEARFLAGRMMVPNFRALGLNSCTVHFRATDAGRKSEAVPAIAALDGVLAAYDMLGPDVCVDLCFRDEADRHAKVAAIDGLLGGASSSLFLDLPLPALARPLSPLDWRIVLAHMGDATRAPEEVGAELGVSGRTVRRRLAALVSGGAVDVVGNFDPGRLNGHLMVYLLLRLRPGAGRNEAKAVQRAFRRRWLAQWSPPERDLADVVIVTVAASAGEADDLRREAITVPAVARAETLVLSGVASRPEWLGAAVQERAAPRPVPAPGRQAVVTVARARRRR